MVLQPEKFIRVLFHERDIPKIFKENEKLFKFTRKQFSMIDIGTGPGTVLLKMETILPKNYKEIIAADRSGEMIKYFDSLPKDPRISSKIFDIQDEKIPEDMKGRFDLVFSTYCFQYVANLTKAFRNCKELLKPGGETFIAWSARSHVFEVYRSMSKIEKWKPYMSDYKNWKSLIEFDDKIGTLKNHIEEAGLKALKIAEYQWPAFEDTEEVILEAFESQDKLLHRIPQIDRQKYKEDYNRIVCSEQMVSTVETNAGKICKVPFETVVAITEKN